MPVDLSRLNAARTMLERAAASGVFGGAVALVAYQGRTVAHWAVGQAQVEPVGRTMQADTIFDLASLTKPVAGATAALLLVEDGVWSLDDRVARFIPEFAVCGKEDITIRQLLTHSSGLSAWAAMYVFARDPETALQFVCSLEPVYAPGTDVQYSDVGYSLLGHLVRRVTGERIDKLLARRVWRPLGMSDTDYRPGAALKRRIAATERGNRYEAEMVRNLGQRFEDWRDPDTILVGEVNDGNTYYALEGVSSHAGLFSTAADLVRFASMYLTGGAGVLSPASIAAAIADQTEGLRMPRGLGWDLAARSRQTGVTARPAPATSEIHAATPARKPTGRSYGDLLSARTFGHTGFTGTSMVIDPERELVVILLTNRTHPDATNDGISTVRPRFHNIVAASLLPD